MEKHVYEANDSLKRALFSWHKEYFQNQGYEDGCCNDDKFNADIELARVIEMMFLGSENQGDTNA